MNIESDMDLMKIKEDIRLFLVRFSSAQLKDDDMVFGRGAVNSLFAMQLVIHLEKQYGIRVDNKDLDLKNFESINVISAFIERKLLAQTS